MLTIIRQLSKKNTFLLLTAVILMLCPALSKAQLNELTVFSSFHIGDQNGLSDISPENEFTMDSEPFLQSMLHTLKKLAGTELPAFPQIGTFRWTLGEQQMVKRWKMSGNQSSQPLIL